MRNKSEAVTKAIEKKIFNISEIESQVCHAVSSACMLMTDEETAHELLGITREHIKLSQEVDELFDADRYLEYVKSVVDLAESISLPLNPMLVELKDSYKFLEKNKSSLRVTLYKLKSKRDVQKRRENYWMN